METLSDTTCRIVIEQSSGYGDIIICAITILGSILTAALTFYLTRRLKNHEIYFNKKSEAYEDYIETAIAFAHSSDYDIDDVLTSFYIASMYCDEDMLKDVQGLITAATQFKDNEISAEKYLIAIADIEYRFRDDLKRCTKYHL